MRSVILLLAGIAAAAGVVLIVRSRPQSRSVEDLAQHLQTAWSDYHTVV